MVVLQIPIHQYQTHVCWLKSTVELIPGGVQLLTTKAYLSISYFRHVYVHVYIVLIVHIHLHTYMYSGCGVVLMNFVVIDLLNIFLMITKIYIYRLYQLGIEGRTQKAKPV